MKSKTLKHVGAWCKEQLPIILSGAAVIGVVITGVLTAKAAVKAEKKLDQLEEPTTLDKVKAIAPIYAPSIVVGGATIACVLSANRANLKRYATLAGTCVFAESQLQAHKDKIVELFGKEKSR